MSGSQSGEGTVLLPTGYDASSYTCVRSLASRGVDVLVASEKDNVPAAASKYCTETASLPPPREHLVAYRDELLALAGRDDVTTVIPVRPEDGYLLSKYREAFAAEVSLAVPSADQIRPVHDRLALAAAANRAGVPVPDTRLLSDVTDWTGEQIVKSRYNVLVDAYLPDRDPSDLAVVKDLHHVARGETVDEAVVREAMAHDPIVQEFVPKDGEYMFAGLYDHGEPLATFQHHQIRGNSYTGGGGVYRRSMYDPDLEDVARDLLAELDYHGLACIEYMRHAETGEYVLTEINPRMWQSLPSTVHAGADFPWYYWLQVTGRADEIVDDYEMGVGTHLLPGEVGYLASVLTDDSPNVPRPSVVGSAWDVVASCVTEPHFDYLKADDPRPFLAGFRSKLSL